MHQLYALPHKLRKKKHSNQSIDKLTVLFVALEIKNCNQQVSANIQKTAALSKKSISMPQKFSILDLMIWGCSIMPVETVTE